jgi:hypothetical protein
MRSDKSILRCAISLCNEACFAVALQHRRLQSAEPEDDTFVFRWWVDIQFLIVALRRLRRSAEIAGSVPTLSGIIKIALGEFDDTVPGLATMRNVGEHVEDYALGQGRDTTVSPSELQVGCLDWPVYSWLGVSLNLDSALGAAEKLLQAVRGCSRLI